MTKNWHEKRHFCVSLIQKKALSCEKKALSCEFHPCVFDTNLLN